MKKPATKEAFNPEELNLLSVKILRSDIFCPDEFDSRKVREFGSNFHLEMGINLPQKTARLEIVIGISTISTPQNGQEAKGNFKFAFFFGIENTFGLAEVEGKGVEVDSDLAISLASVSYSTARGILYSRLLGTALNGFFLPIINARSLLNSESN